MRTWKWTMAGAVAVASLWLVTPWTSCSSATGGTTPTVSGESQDAAMDAGPTEPDAAVEEAVEAVDEEAVEPEAELAPEAEAEPEPQTLAEKFVAAGGQKLCLAMVYQLNPDWRMDACSVVKDAADGTDRRAACENQRRPLRQFAEDVCKTVIEESLRLDLDPGLVLSVIERESSFGRAQWDRQDRRYEVQTDICKLTLPKSRIVERRPGRREGTELMTWTYGPQAPQSGQVARNRQPVIVVEEDDDRVVLNTCAAGEAGIMQTVPREWRAGTTIEATGEVLAGSTAERRRRVETDPVLQVRLGCQALVEHRALMPSEGQTDWMDWIHVYNTGSVVRSDHGREYARKIARHYLDACRGWVMEETEIGIPITKDVDDLWPECGRIREVLDRLSTD